MTDDKELIARLRDADLYNAQHYERDPLHKQAADRIEALTKERDEADDLAKAAFADGASNNIRLAETSYRVKWLEAKLAKAVAFLDKIATTGCWFTSDMNDLIKELKGESHA